MFSRYQAQLGTLLLGWCSIGCEAQATAQYDGEPLLRLSGEADVEVSTGGLPVLPALCFFESSHHYKTITTADLPPQAGVEAPPGIAWVDNRATIVEVDSVGEFPAQFNVAVYTPPPDSVLKPLFSGEPRSADGAVCAVKAEHPDVVNMPVIINQPCAADDAPCERWTLWSFLDSQRFYKAVYQCPDANSPKDDCSMSTLGDPSVQREFYEDVLGRDRTQVVYLADPAPRGSFTAWKYGATNGLSAGYHLFAYQGLLSSSDPTFKCRTDAGSRAVNDTFNQFGGHFEEDADAGVAVIDPAYEKEYYEALERRTAEYEMHDCPMPTVMELSADQALSITINRDSPFDPFSAPKLTAQ